MFEVSDAVVFKYGFAPSRIGTEIRDLARP